jgi:hypothetical protein
MGLAPFLPRLISSQSFFECRSLGASSRTKSSMTESSVWLTWPGRIAGTRPAIGDARRFPTIRRITKVAERSASDLGAIGLAPMRVAA